MKQRLRSRSTKRRSRISTGGFERAGTETETLALQSAVNLLNEREKRTRLAHELAKIDPKEEREFAEPGLGDRSWPEY